jgi:predicted AlkP superfamily pyrophosphatase or phosphodiesterase
VIRDLRASVLRSGHDRWIFPRYDGFSFANIPGALLSLFGIDSESPPLDDSILEPIRSRRFEHVMLLLIDGLERASSLPFFRRIAERGSVTSLTAVFPSTTSASLTTLATGLTPQEHGLPEWMVYLEEIDEVITSLPFKRWNGKARDELLQLGYDASILFEGKPIFETLAERGIESVSFCSADYSHSAYSRASRRGSRTVPFLGASDLAVRIADELEAARGPRLLYVYWDGLDSLEHAFSPGSRETTVELGGLAHLFGEQLRGLLSPLGRNAAEKTLLIVTADHGQVRVDPRSTIYLTDSAEVRGALAVKRNGEPILPTGSMRDVFLHVRPGAVDETHAMLAQLLEGKAEVWRTSEAFERGLFGRGTPTRRFRNRVGDLLVLPYPGETVWAQYPGAARPHSMRGHHGGLSAEEMFIPLGETMLAEAIEG